MLQVHRTNHISSHVWHTNYPSHYGYTECTIFHLCYEMYMTYEISCKETCMKHDSKSHVHFLHLFIARNMGFGPVLMTAATKSAHWNTINSVLIGCIVANINSKQFECYRQPSRFSYTKYVTQKKFFLTSQAIYNTHVVLFPQNPG